MTPDLHVVLGATGGVGVALTAALADRGHAVRAVSRSGATPVDGVQPHAADVTDPTALAAALRGATVVHHAAQPPYTTWPERFPAMTAGIADATAAVGARLVMVDNLYGYGPVAGGYGPTTPAGPMTETTPQTATGRKGAVRRAMAGQLLARHAAGDLEVVIGRLGDYFGPGGTASLVGEDLFRSVLAGRTVTWPASAAHPHSFAYLPDVAAALVRLATDDRAVGRVWHLPHAPATTPRAFVSLVQDVAGVPHRLRTVPRPVLSAVGLLNPMVRELGELAYQVDRPFVVDDRALERTFGPVHRTPVQTAIDTTLRWFRDQAAHEVPSDRAGHDGRHAPASPQEVTR